MNSTTFLELFTAYLSHDLTLESDGALAPGAADFHVVPLVELDRVLCHGAGWTISEVEAVGHYIVLVMLYNFKDNFEVHIHLNAR